RVPRRGRPAAAGAATSHPAHLRARRRGGPGRGVVGHLPAPLARRVAAPRPHRAGAVGRRARPARAAPPRVARAIRGVMSWVIVSDPQYRVLTMERPGLAPIGVGRDGAADRAAHALAARLLAQDPSVAGLEVLLGGLVLRVEAAGSRVTPLTICLAGAPAPAT